MKCDFAVVVTLESELEAILSVMPDRRSVRPSSLLYHEGTIEGFRVTVAQSTDKGSVCSALVATELIREYDPQFLVLLGIAAGYRDQGLELGNVIVPDSIMGYEYSKVYDDHGESKSRLFAPDNLAWQVLSLVKMSNDSCPTFKPGRLASGNKVVASKDFRRKLEFETGSKISALEMESEGVAQAARNFGKPFLVIKGISDYADNETKGYTTPTGKTDEQKAKEAAEVRERQKVAGKASAEVFVQLLRKCRQVSSPFPEKARLSRPIDVLHRIQNFGTSGLLESTTVSKHTVTSPEMGLKRGDETLVLTNSLSTYDATPPAVEEIRSNLLRGAKYSYFLPEDQSRELDGQKRYLMERLTDGVDVKKAKTLVRNINFYSVAEECIFNFATILKNGALTGFWYIVSSNPSNHGDPEMVLLQLESGLAHDLMDVFQQLKRSSKVDPTDTTFNVT